MKTSKQLWSELHQEIRSLISFNTEEESVGKTVKAVYHGWIDSVCNHHGVCAIQFTDNSVLYYDGNYYTSYPVLMIRTWYDDFRHGGYAFIDEELKFFIECGFTTKEAAEPLLELGKQYEEAKHAENIKQEIQKHLDEISALKDQLK